MKPRKTKGEKKVKAWIATLALDSRARRVLGDPANIYFCKEKPGKPYTQIELLLPRLPKKK